VAGERSAHALDLDGLVLCYLRAFGLASVMDAQVRPVSRFAGVRRLRPQLMAFHYDAPRAVPS
jgi:hypothetical protein